MWGCSYMLVSWLSRINKDSCISYEKVWLNVFSRGNKTSLCFCKSHESTRIGQGSFNFPGAVYTLWLSKHYYMALIKPTGIAAAHFTWKCLLEKKKSNLVPWKLQVTLPENNLRSYSVRDGGLPLKNCMVLTIYVDIFDLPPNIFSGREEWTGRGSVGHLSKYGRWGLWIWPTMSQPILLLAGVHLPFTTFYIFNLTHAQTCS